MKTAPCIRAALLACLFSACGLLFAASAPARETPVLNTAAWCRSHAQNNPALEAQCTTAEHACRAALPDMAPAGGCPDRQLDRCQARLSAANSWCAILCCLDPEHETCRKGLALMPVINSLLPPESNNQ
jgi:hypothetical protein